MRLAIASLALILPLVSFAGEKFELPARGSLVNLDEGAGDEDLVPAPFSYNVCEELLSSEKAKEIRKQFDSKIILYLPSHPEHLKDSVWALFNMTPADIRSEFWQAEFADLGHGEVSFRIVKQGGSVAYEKPLPHRVFINKILDANAQRWAKKSPYVVLEEREDVRIILFANNSGLGDGQYFVSVDVPCGDVPTYIKLPIEDFFTDNAVVQTNGKLLCRIQAMHIIVNPRYADPAHLDPALAEFFGRVKKETRH